MRQPKSTSHPIYAQLDKHLLWGDQKIIALELGIGASTVSSVKRGSKHSRRVWDKIIQVYKKRRAEDEALALSNNLMAVYAKD